MRTREVLPIWRVEHLIHRLNRATLAFRRNAYEHLYEKLARGDTSNEAVGRGDFDRIGRIEVDLLLMAGLKPTDTLMGFGCGTGRLAVHVIPTLQGGRYIGIDRLTQAGFDSSIFNCSSYANPTSVSGHVIYDFSVLVPGGTANVFSIGAIPNVSNNLIFELDIGSISLHFGDAGVQGGRPLSTRMASPIATSTSFAPLGGIRIERAANGRKRCRLKMRRRRGPQHRSNR